MSAALRLSSPAGILKFFRVCYCLSSVYLVLPKLKLHKPQDDLRRQSLLYIKADT